MFIKDVTPRQFTSAFDYVNSHYAHNLLITDLSDHSNSKGPRINVRLGVHEGKGIGRECAVGARRSASGRRGPWICWHATRDILNVMFQRTPDAYVKAGIHWRVEYKGIDGFRETYPLTAQTNMGSMFNPQYMPELCECSSRTRDALSLPPTYTIKFPL